MLLRRSEESQERALAVIGAGVMLVLALALLLVTSNPFGRTSADRIAVAIDTPYVGQGVEPGTAVVMHGVKVGQVTNVSSLPGGGVQLQTDLQKHSVEGLTDAMHIDFRPINYFGVPGVNFIPGQGGQQLRGGAQISLQPKGNFTLSEMLSQLGDVSAGALTPRLIKVIDRTTRYTDGLNPFFETMVTVTTALADVQQLTTAQLLAHTSTMSTGVPSFTDVATEAGERFISLNLPQETSTTPAAATGPRLTPPYLEGVKVSDFSDETEEYFQNVYKPFLDMASEGLFLAVGRLESTHVDELLPLVEGMKSITDVMPVVIRPDNFARTLVELRSRFERLYAGNGEQRALQVRILLDSLPAVAAPLGIQTLPPDSAPAPLAAESSGEVPAAVDGVPHGGAATTPGVEGIPE